MVKYLCLFLLFFFLLLTFNAKSKISTIPALGCKHPLEKGIESSNKMQEVMSKLSNVSISDIVVFNNVDTITLESPKLNSNDSTIVYYQVIFINEKIVEIAYFYEFENESLKDEFCKESLTYLRNKKSGFTELANDLPVHTSAVRFWNFLTPCKEQNSVPALCIETFKMKFPTVRISYLY